MNRFSSNFSLELFDDKFLKSLSKDVIRRCIEFNVIISSDFAFLAIQLFSFHPVYGIPLNTKINESFIEKFVNKCVQKLLDSDSPSIKTIEMQSLFMSSSLNVDTICRKYVEKMNLTTETLLKEIIEYRATTKDEQDKCFKKIVIDIVVTNKLGKPSNPKVITETTNALKSVMSRADLVSFLNLPKDKRLETLRSLRQIVCGIRLFNKDAGHCEEGIMDIISDITEAYNDTKIVLNNTNEMLLKRIDILQKALLNIFTIDKETNEIRYTFKKFATNDEIEFLKDVTIMNYQHAHYVKSLIEFMDQLEKEIENRFNEYRYILKNLHEIVQFRVAITTDKVFPHFIKLSDVWHALLNFLYLMVDVNKINEKCLEISELEPSYICLAEKIIENNDYYETECATIKDRPKPYGMMNFKCENDCKIIKNVNISMIPTFNKFCTYLFTIGNGILIPSQLNLGLIQYNEKNYAFSNEKYAQIFTINVEESVEKFLDAVKNRPATIIFFDLFDEIKENVKFKTIIRTDNSEKSLNKVKLDQEIQTELHPIPYRKDKDYTWNIWDLRRRAIKLADIKKLRTHSAQTDISFYRRSCNLQIELPNREVETQTKIDNSTCISKIDELKYFNVNPM